tara:strand:+ start:331 stop:543 length:213 start_codon:yes stop_codon:yes gene_type:complete
MTNGNITFARHLHQWEDANWQLIFKTANGLDYCRETVTIASCPDKDAITEHAAFLLTLNNETEAVVIERW